MQRIRLVNRARRLSVAAMNVAVVLAIGHGTVTHADIIGLWHFDESAGETVASEQILGNDAALSGTVDFITDGVAGNAIEFSTSGSGLGVVGDAYPLTNQDFSIVMWVRTNPGDTSGNLFPMARHRSTILAGYIMAINTSGSYGETNKAWFYQSNSPGAEPISTTSVNDGTWHQFAVSYVLGGTVAIYVDGAPIENERTAIPINSISAPLIFGGLDVSGVPTALFNGAIDEVQIYDHALQPCDVEFLFANPTLTVEENPCPGDLDGNEAVDVNDLLSLLAQWGNAGGSGDVNCDLSVDVDDLLALLSAWGPC